MARTSIPMDWAELRRSRNRDRIIGYGFWAAGFTVLLIGALKMVYEAGFVPLRDFAVAAIAPVWWIPVVQLLWQLDHQYIFALFLGLGFIGAIFLTIPYRDFSMYACRLAGDTS